MRVMVLLPVLISLGACTTAEGGAMRAKMEADEQARLAKKLEGFTAGEPRSCIDTRDLRGPESFGDRTLLFQVSRNFYYRSDVNGSCQGVGKGEALVTKQFGSQMCRGDIARSVDLVAGFQRGSCALGEFVPYRRGKPAG